MLKKTGAKTEPWGTSLVTGHQLDLTLFTTTLCAWPFIQFFIQRRVHPPRPWAAGFSRRILWGTVSKALLKSSHMSPQGPQPCSSYWVSPPYPHQHAHHMLAAEPSRAWPEASGQPNDCPLGPAASSYLIFSDKMK